MVRILLISRGLRPWLHSTTDHPYLDPAGACGKGTIFLEKFKTFFKEKDIIERMLFNKYIYHTFSDNYKAAKNGHFQKSTHPFVAP